MLLEVKTENIQRENIDILYAVYRLFEFKLCYWIKYLFPSNNFINPLLVQCPFWLFLKCVEILIFTGMVCIKPPFFKLGGGGPLSPFSQSADDHGLTFHFPKSSVPLHGIRFPCILSLNIFPLSLINAMDGVIVRK